jgi:hypothetical protein
MVSPVRSFAFKVTCDDLPFGVFDTYKEAKEFADAWTRFDPTKYYAVVDRESNRLY